jgi:hypothetical protein
MKKLIASFIFMLLFLSGFAQYQMFDKCVMEFTNLPNSLEALKYENDSVSFSFRPSSISPWRVSIKNKIPENCEIDWDRGIFEVNGKSGKIIFGEDSRLTKDRKKEPSRIMPNSELEQNIFPDVLVLDSSMGRFYYKKLLKKTGMPVTYRILLPIIYKKGDVKDYLFAFKVYYPQK